MEKMLLNRTTAAQAIRFFDICFKRGVVDACEFEENIGVKEFLERKSSDWTFGVVGRDDYDPEMFRATLYWWARKNGLKSLAEKYIFQMNTKSYNTSFLFYCMRFYLLGIKEWLQYPNPLGIQVFKNTPKVHWVAQDTLKSFCRGDYFSYMHEFSYEYRVADIENRFVSTTAMDSFCMALFDMTKTF